MTRQFNVVVERAAEGRCYACFLSRMELLYRGWKDEDERAGRAAGGRQPSAGMARLIARGACPFGIQRSSSTWSATRSGTSSTPLRRPTAHRPSQRRR